MTPKPKSKPNETVAATRERLAVACRILEPEERAQRQWFSELMPELYLLRQRGFSFRQLTVLLNESGFDLQPGTVRFYYYEMLDERMEQCEQRFNEQMVVLQVQATHASSAPKMASKIAAMRQHDRGMGDERACPVWPAPADTSIVPPTTCVQTEKARPPVPSDDLGHEPVGGSFGLLGGDGEKVLIKPGGGFFDMDLGDPQIPPALEVLRCMPLRADVTSIGRRPGVPPAVYEEGLLEHPAIPGLMLSREQRLYGALLEVCDPGGEIFMETVDQKRFRIKWAKPVATAGSEEGFVPFHADTLPEGRR